MDTAPKTPVKEIKMASNYSKLWLILPFYDGHAVDGNRLMQVFNPNLRNGENTFRFLRELGVEMEMKGQAEYEGSGLTSTLQALCEGYQEGTLVRGEVTVTVPPSDNRLFEASIAARRLTISTGKQHRRKKQQALTQSFHYVCLKQDEELLRQALLNFEDFGRGVRDNPYFTNVIEQNQGFASFCLSSDPDRIEESKKYIRHTWLTVRHEWYKDIRPVYFTLDKHRADNFMELMGKYASPAN